MKFSRLKENYHIVVMLIFFLISLVVPATKVMAEDANVHFGSEIYDTTEGEAFRVGVYINTESGVGEYKVTVKYDPSTLEYVDGADSVDKENGLLTFTGSNGGPEVKYLVNFNVKGDSNTAVSFASADVKVADNSEVMNATVGAAAPIRVAAAPEEETIQEEESELPPDDTETPVLQQQLQTITEVPKAAPAEEENKEESSIFYNAYFIIILVTLGIVAGVELITLFIKFVVKKLKERESEEEFYVDETDTSDSIQKPLKSTKSAVQLYGNLPVLDLESDEEFVHEQLAAKQPMQPKHRTDMTEEEKQEVVISVDDVTMEFHIASQQTNGFKDYLIQLLKRQITYRKLFALNHVSFDVFKGEVVGIIGTNGSGKSTMLKIVSGALRPTSGSVKVDRKKVQLLTLGTGFDMELTGRENVYLNGAIIGYSKEFLDAHYDEIVEFAELQDFMDEKVKNYSSGMVSRLGFAIATAGDAAEILILDEVLSVGDEFFRKKSLARVKEMIHGGSTVLIVSHSMPTIIDNCSKVVWIEKGNLRMIGEPKEVCKAYQQMNRTNE